MKLFKRFTLHVGSRMPRAWIAVGTITDPAHRRELGAILIRLPCYRLRRDFSWGARYYWGQATLAFYSETRLNELSNVTTWRRPRVLWPYADE